jgi:NAD(P)-dependent dehydrogenase (short-subunit alcohol dehydrogenase family)
MNDGGSIIINGSVASVKGTSAFGVYGATKAALRSFVRTWTVDLEDRHIRSNVISPGPTDARNCIFGRPFDNYQSVHFAGSPVCVRKGGSTVSKRRSAAPGWHGFHIHGRPTSVTTARSALSLLVACGRMPPTLTRFRSIWNLTSGGSLALGSIEPNSPALVLPRAELPTASTHEICTWCWAPHPTENKSVTG